MLLSEQTRLSFSQCLVCRRAGEADTIIWPQEPLSTNQGFGGFEVYIQDPTTGQGAHNKRAQYCRQHWTDLYRELEYMMKLEVTEQYAYDQWIERTET